MKLPIIRKKIEKLMQRVFDSEDLNQESIRQHAEDTPQKASQMMQTYLGEDPYTLDALEFLLRLAEGGEVTHYEVLSEAAKQLKEKRFATEIKSILKEEKERLKLCTQLANSTRS